MAAKNTQQQHKSIALPTDVKPRLKWTPELHQLFVNAVALLGGAGSLVYLLSPSLNCYVIYSIKIK